MSATKRSKDVEDVLADMQRDINELKITRKMPEDIKLNYIRMITETMLGKSWSYGADSFTIDFWVRFTVLPSAGGRVMIYSQIDDGINGTWFGLYNDAGVYTWQFKDMIAGNAHIALASWSIAPVVDTWYHLALVRSGSSWCIFQNGSLITNAYSNSEAVEDRESVLRIGGWIPNYPLNGWLDEVRVSKGVARWTTDFTPPTSAYTPDSYTMLLLHADGADASTTLIDSSASSKPVTTINHAQIDTAQSKFGGASGLFDGTDDYVTPLDFVPLSLSDSVAEGIRGTISETFGNADSVVGSQQTTGTFLVGTAKVGFADCA